MNNFKKTVSQEVNVTENIVIDSFSHATFYHKYKLFYRNKLFYKKKTKQYKICIQVFTLLIPVVILCFKIQNCCLHIFNCCRLQFQIYIGQTICVGLRLDRVTVYFVMQGSFSFSLFLCSLPN